MTSITMQVQLKAAPRSISRTDLAILATRTGLSRAEDENISPALRFIDDLIEAGLLTVERITHERESGAYKVFQLFDDYFCPPHERGVKGAWREVQRHEMHRGQPPAGAVPIMTPTEEVLFTAEAVAACLQALDGATHPLQGEWLTKWLALHVGGQAVAVELPVAVTVPAVQSVAELAPVPEERIKRKFLKEEWEFYDSSKRSCPDFDDTMKDVRAAHQKKHGSSLSDDHGTYLISEVMAACSLVSPYLSIRPASSASAPTRPTRQQNDWCAPLGSGMG